MIHTDFEKGFIRAQVIKYETSSNTAAKAPFAKPVCIHVEGKEYVVQDGDIMHFLFNV